MAVTSPRFSRESSERRRSWRFIVVDSRITSSVVDVVVRDLSSQGMSVESRRQLRVGASYPFKIHERGESVALHGVVKWCRLQRMIDIGGGESQALYISGIAFSTTRSTPPAGAIPMNDENEMSRRLERFELENRRSVQAGLADLVEAFIKDSPSES